MRPSRNTDRLLVRAARELLPKTGCSGLNLRQVAARAGVNLGMFHYHFGSKEAFIRRVLQEVYDELFALLDAQASQKHLSPSARLETALVEFGKFARDNRDLIVALLGDVLNGEKEVLQFVKDNLGRHVALLAGLIAECDKRHGVNRSFPLPWALIYLLLSANGPSIVVQLLERFGGRRLFHFPLKQVEALLLTDKALAERVEFTIRSIWPGARRSS